MGAIRGLPKKIFCEALDLIFPRTCVSCGVWTGPSGASVCADCASGIEYLGRASSRLVCARCGKFLPNPSADCPRCLGPAGPPRYYTASRSAAVYDGKLRELIHKYKYGNSPRLGGFFAGMLAASISAFPEIAEFDIIVPVPLHPIKKLRRGYNQSDIIARGLARLVGKKCASSALARAKYTRAQAALDGNDRRANVESAFRVRAPLAVRGRAVLLVDDVMTTGATLDACAAALAAAGAAKVFCLTVACD